GYTLKRKLTNQENPLTHLYANGKNTCSHSYPHALTTFSRKISHIILFINHILSFFINYSSLTQSRAFQGFFNEKAP
ncbi:hypothetical protein, partial [Phocaeicola vulgatus]|uniref:hypothetical protein n=1 Tax=Phocaeicola vulgatus TaxID=821 RepID=UPI001C702E3A